MNKNTHVLHIHGGMTFKREKDYISYLKNRPITLGKRIRWSGDYYEKALGKNFMLTRPDMPFKDNAKYEEWKICFKRYLDAIISTKQTFVLTGMSLGGIFLAKYLSEHKLKRKAVSVIIVGAPFDNTIIGEDLVNGFKLKSNLSLINENTKNLHFFFSKDDDCVPFSHLEKYKKKLPKAQYHVFDGVGHFKVQTLPKIVSVIKKDCNIK